VFSERLDEIMGLMVKGEIPNVGRFCGYCYTPLAKGDERCAHCGRSRAEYAPVAKIPPEFFTVYKAMRKRESLVVNSFAYAGLALALMLFTALVAVAVYRFDAAWGWLAFATAVFIIGGRVFAGLLGGWIGDNVGFDYARRKLAIDWAEYERSREQQRADTPSTRDHAASAS
jgi:hypothetical protein